MSVQSHLLKIKLVLLVLVVLLTGIGQPIESAQAGSQRQDSTPTAVFIQPVRTGFSLPLEGETAAQPQEIISQTLNSFPSNMPGNTSWEGLNNGDNKTVYALGRVPPNVNGDVGPGHYIQTVNSLFRVWNHEGVPLTTQLYKISSLFAGLGVDNICAKQDEGSPLVIYDHLADRWVISQPAVDITPPAFEFHQCVAVSQTFDPLGPKGWYLYDYLVSTTKTTEDPRIGVWGNGYYLTFNQKKWNGIAWVAGGQGVAVLEREKMLSGQSAKMAYVDLESSHPALGGMLPADLDGAAPPPGTPDYFVQVDDNNPTNGDQLQIWTLDVNWASNPPTTAWGEASPGHLPVNAFDSNLCNGSLDCIPQPGAAADARLDALSDPLMYRLQYRYLNGAGNMVLNHTVDVGSDHAGLRWYHLQVDGTGLWSVKDQGTYAPDANHRWMGSAAMDVSGNIAVGYSVSSATVYPSIRYAGRLSSDPAGQLGQGEVIIVNGGGIQTDTASRWGEYSMMAVDPVDQCTFWYTSEYIAATNEWSITSPWRTKIANFNFGSENCAQPDTYSISGYVIDSTTGQNLADATVMTDNGYFATTSPDGIYTLSGLAEGTYELTAGKLGWTSASRTQSVGPNAQDVDFFLEQSKVYLPLVMR